MKESVWREEKYYIFYKVRADRNILEHFQERIRPRGVSGSSRTFYVKDPIQYFALISLKS